MDEQTIIIIFVHVLNMSGIGLVICEIAFERLKMLTKQKTMR